VTEDLDAGAADDVVTGFFVAFGVYQVAAAQAEDCAVGQQLVQVGVRVSGWLLGLVLGIDDGDR